MEEPSSDSRKTQVKELEQIVKKLQEENMQLLNKVSLSSQQQTGSLPTTNAPADDDLEESLLDLDTDTTLSDGEWLYVSPKISLTPVQKKQSPLQWLSEGHNRLGEVDIPSLDEVRKTLVFNIEEAETISKAAHPRSDPSNSTAKKYLSRVRERSRSNSPVQQLNGDEPPNQQNTNTETNDVPIVKWKAKMLQEENEDVPVVKWKAKMPQEENEDVPVVKWKAKMPQEENEDVPVVKWKAKMPQEENEDVSVVKWKAKMPQEENEDVPVVKWKAKMPQEENEDVPVVKWKAKMPQEENEDVPIVKWKAKMPQEENEDVPVVKWKAKMPPNNSAQSKSQGQIGLTPKSTGLMRPIAVKRTEGSPTKIEQTHKEHSSLKAPVHSELRQPQSPSASPTGLQRRLKMPSSQLARDNSPSPPTGGTKRRLMRPPGTSPSRRSLSPARSNLTQPGGSPKNNKRQLPGSGSPSSSLKHPSGLSTGQAKQQVSRLQAHKESQQITPPPNTGSGIRTPGSSGLRGPSTLGSGRRGLTPPKASAGAKSRRMLPTPPSAARAVQRPQQSTEADDDEGDTWLEGCY